MAQAYDINGNALNAAPKAYGLDGNLITAAPNSAPKVYGLDGNPITVDYDPYQASKPTPTAQPQIQPALVTEPTHPAQQEPQAAPQQLPPGMPHGFREGEGLAALAGQQFTDVPHEIGSEFQAARQRYEQDFTRPIEQLPVTPDLQGVSNTMLNSLSIAKRVGGTAMDYLGEIASPAVGASTSILGRPIEAATKGAVPRELTGNLAATFIPVAGAIGKARGAGLVKEIGEAAEKIYSPVTSSVQRFLAPATTKGGRYAAQTLRRETGSAKVTQARIEQKLAQHMKTTARLPVDQQRNIVKYIESTPVQRRDMLARGDISADHGKVGDDIGLTMQFYKQAIQRILSPEDWPNFVDNYYTHLWKERSGKVLDTMQNFMAGKQGSARSFKTRKMPTLDEGLQAGLTPKFENPVEVARAYSLQMSRYLAARATQNHLIGRSMAAYHYPGQQPEGWDRLKGVNVEKGPAPGGRRKGSPGPEADVGGGSGPPATRPPGGTPTAAGARSKRRGAPPALPAPVKKLPPGGAQVQDRLIALTPGEIRHAVQESETPPKRGSRERPPPFVDREATEALSKEYRLSGDWNGALARTAHEYALRHDETYFNEWQAYERGEGPAPGIPEKTGNAFYKQIEDDFHFSGYGQNVKAKPPVEEPPSNVVRPGQSYAERTNQTLDEELGNPIGDELITDPKGGPPAIIPGTAKRPDQLRPRDVELPAEAGSGPRQYDESGELIATGGKGPPAKSSSNKGALPPEPPKVKKAPGMQPRRYLYAPRDVARVYNNYISAGFERGDTGPLWEGARKASNGMTMLKLGLSGYHLFTEGREAIAHDLARAFRSLSQGRPISAAKAAAGAIASPVTTAMRGVKAHREMLDIVPQSPMSKKINDAFVRSGGSQNMDTVYRAKEGRTFFDAISQGAFFEHLKDTFKDFHKKPLSKAASLAADILQSTAAPLFEHYIPNLKRGAFSTAMEDWLKTNPHATQEATDQYAIKLQDSIDNRFGELVQDNLFWNKQLKQIAQILMLSPGWNIGTAREIGGGIVDVPASVSGILKGKGVTDRTAYNLALASLVAMEGSALTYMLAGKTPEGKDFVAPRTGGTDDYGEPERMLTPGYQKDVLAFSEDFPDNVLPEISNKMNPALSSALDYITNKDYRGLPIYKPKNAIDIDADVDPLAEDIAERFMPISIASAGKGYGPTSKIGPVQRLTGIRRAPSYIEDEEEVGALRQRRETTDWKRRIKADLRAHDRQGK